MWRTSPPIVTVAWATGWPWLIACPSGRSVTVIVTGVPGPGGHADPGGRDRGRPGGPRAGHAAQDGAGPDDLGVFQVAADAAEQVLGGGNHPAEFAGLGRGGPHAEHHADDRDRAARHRPDRSEGQAPARLRA
jgi:hypothetical protein